MEARAHWRCIGLKRFDLHIHSIYSSDGTASVKEIVEQARREGLSGIAITDHNEVKGAHEAAELARELDGFIVIPGTEVSSASGHILAYGISSKIERELSVAETIKAIRDQGGLAAAAHPYRFWSGLGEKETISGDFDAIEARNARSPEADNSKALAIAEKRCLPMTAGSDSHELGSIGGAYIEIDDPEDTIKTAADVLAAIKNNKASAAGSSRDAQQSLSFAKKSITGFTKRGFKRV